MANLEKPLKGGMEMNPETSLATEIWFRAEDLALLQQKKIFKTARLGNRQNGICETKGCYQPGKFVTLKILQKPETKQFLDWQTDILITQILLKKFSDLSDNDLKNSLPNQKTVFGLKNKLEEFYKRPIKPDDILTIIEFEYKENLKSVRDLVAKGVLNLAKQPLQNPQNFKFEHYTLPLIEHDYPAKTPIMWNSVYQEFGIKAGNIMLVGDPAQSKDILDILRKDPKYQGGGCGVGFKDEAIKYLDELDPMALAIGSVNFIIKTPEGKLKGFNTDGKGYALALEDKLKQRKETLKGKKIVILGAGGTGNALAFALTAKQAQLVILNRTVTKAKNLAERINQYFSLIGDKSVRFGGEDLIPQEVLNADVIINVSTKGSSGEMEQYNALAPAKLPNTKENIKANLRQAKDVLQIIPKKAIISDIVLTTEQTPLLKEAQKSGFETLDGIPMVVNQGVEAFWLLYGQKLQANNITKKQVAQVMKKAAGL